MESNPSSIYQDKLLICFYSDPNFFSLNLLENLLSKNCLVNVITKEVETWKENTSHLSKSLFGITHIKKHLFEKDYHYAIYCGGFNEIGNAYDDLNHFLQDPKTINIKRLVIFPFESFSFDNSKTFPLNDNLGVIYLGDIVGARLNLDSNLLISQNIKEILYNRNLTLRIGERFYPLFVSDATKIICKWLFSFGPYGKEIFLLGKEISVTDFWKANKKYIPELKLNYHNDENYRQIPRGYEVKIIESNLDLALSETYRWINAMWFKDEIPKKIKSKKSIPKIVFVNNVFPVKKNSQKNKPKNRSKYSKLYRTVIALLALILLSPFLTLGASLGLMYSSFKNFNNGDFDKIENSALISKTLFVVTRSQSAVLSKIPILGSIYSEALYVSQIGEIVSDLTIKAIPLMFEGSEVFEKILGNEIYDPTENIKTLSQGLRMSYDSTVQIQKVTKEANENKIYTSKLLSQKVDFERLKTLFSKGDNIVQNLSEILGKEDLKSYMLLFQNNMELRPTGGFIGSYGIMNFDGGRMSELIVNDVYSADGQLKGHVEPPVPIKNYLGEANWWLRDSNWDPDFTTSAQRAEWFLDKEVDQKVDGVIGTDLEVAKDILGYTGPVFLPDYNLNINQDNLYEKTQEEVEKNFFPGSRKKSSFLTALSRALLSEVVKLDNTKKVQVLKSIFTNLEERHIQIYLHEEVAQNAINQLGWSGIITKPNCGDGCEADFVGLVEANLGVNKANYFIKRSVDLTLNITPEEVSKTLYLKLDNIANPQLGPSGRYKTYIRILVPDNAEMQYVRSIVGSNIEELNMETSTIKGRKEVGVIVEVLGSQSKTIEFHWTDPVSLESTKYGLYIRKQAGVTDDPWNIQALSAYGDLGTKPQFSLTKDGSYRYNTILSRDFVSLFVW